MKKIICLLVLLMCLSTLAGCVRVDKQETSDEEDYSVLSDKTESLQDKYNTNKVYRDIFAQTNYLVIKRNTVYFIIDAGDIQECTEIDKDDITSVITLNVGTYNKIEIKTKDFSSYYFTTDLDIKIN